MLRKKDKNVDPRRSNEPMQGGRRQSDIIENPYLSSRRTWNDHVGTVLASRRNAQIVGILSLLIALAAVGGVIHIGSQSKFVPYVIEVDDHGQAFARGAVTAANPVSARVMEASVASFIRNSRMVSPDVELQRQAVFATYAYLDKGDPATKKMNEWLNGNEDANPFKKAETSMVSLEIDSVLQQTNDTWQIEWFEYKRDRDGVLESKTAMRALVTVYTAENNDRTDEDIRRNPLGIFVKNFSWSKI